MDIKNNIIIAIDGPAGAGKSTIAKLVAKKLKINYLDTGAMYRAITLKCLNLGIDLSDEKRVSKISEQAKITFIKNEVFLDGENVENEIRTLRVSSKVSNVAKIKNVRINLVELQRKIGLEQDCILDGRDIGSYVFPNANFKFYLNATPLERATRRYKELILKGVKITLEEVLEDVQNRDNIDSNRKFAPLVKADDAVEINTDNMDINDVVEYILNRINI